MMLSFLSGSYLLTILTTSSCAAVFGFLGLFARQSKVGRLWLPPLVISGFLAMVAAGAYVASADVFVWQSATILSATWMGLSLLRFPVFGQCHRTFFQLITTPKGQSALMFLGGISLLIAQGYSIDSQLDNELTETDAIMSQIGFTPELTELSELSAYTDHGQKIGLWAASLSMATELNSDIEGMFLRAQKCDLKVIQTAPADLQYNCHGWVFTGGKYWVRGVAVEKILKDNHYKVVYQPQPGDLAVFRDDAGAVSHTAIVNSIGKNGVILLESKWGVMGRYIHTTSTHAYAHQVCRYYRSARKGHLLRNFAEEKSLLTSK